MSQAHRAAIEYVLKQKGSGVPEMVIQMDFPEFKQGEFVVNRVYRFDPVLVGMYVTAKKLIEFDHHTNARISSYCKSKGLKLHLSGVDLFLEDQRARRIAWLRDNFFGASIPEIFEDIGRQIYSLDPKKEPSKKLFQVIQEDLED